MSQELLFAIGKLREELKEVRSEERVFHVFFKKDVDYFFKHTKCRGLEDLCETIAQLVLTGHTNIQITVERR